MNRKQTAKAIHEGWYQIDCGEPLEVEVRGVDDTVFQVMVRWRADDGAEHELTAHIPHSELVLRMRGVMTLLQGHAMGVMRRAAVVACAPDCPGWAVFDEDGIRTVAKCDECNKFADDVEAGEVAGPIIERGLQMMRDVAQDPLETIKQLVADFLPSTDLGELTSYLNAEAENQRKARLVQAYARIAEALVELKAEADARDVHYEEYRILEVLEDFCTQRGAQVDAGTRSRAPFNTLEGRILAEEKDLLDNG